MINIDKLTTTNNNQLILSKYQTYLITVKFLNKDTTVNSYIIDIYHYLSYIKKDYYQIDLSGYIVDSLKKLSIENIYVSPIDTAIDEEYYSHYRCTYIKPDEKEGRFIAGAMMEKN